MAPLHWAAVKGLQELARLLVDRGADAPAAGGDGWTALRLVAAKGDAALTELLAAHTRSP